MFTPLNTFSRKDLNKNIPESIENADGVNVLREFQGGEEIIFLEFPLHYPYLQLSTKLLRLRKQLNSAPTVDSDFTLPAYSSQFSYLDSCFELKSAPFVKLSSRPTILQLPVQRDGQLFQIGSTMTYEKSFRSEAQGQVQPFQAKFNLLRF